MTVADMGAHIDRLVAEHDVAVTWRDSGGKAYPSERRIAIRPVRSEATYAVALHELGHILAEGGRGRFWMDLEAEVCAWEWALRNADTVGPRFRAAVKRGLESHYRWVLRKQDRAARTYDFRSYLAAVESTPKLPPGDSRFWALKRNGCLCPEAHEGACLP
jgi:hypothetical protein